MSSSLDTSARHQRSSALCVFTEKLFFRDSSDSGHEKTFHPPSNKPHREVLSRFWVANSQIYTFVRLGKQTDLHPHNYGTLKSPHGPRNETSFCFAQTICRGVCFVYLLHVSCTKQMKTFPGDDMHIIVRWSSEGIRLQMRKPYGLEWRRAALLSFLEVSLEIFRICHVHSRSLAPSLTRLVITSQPRQLMPCVVCHLWEWFGHCCITNGARDDPQRWQFCAHDDSRWAALGLETVFSPPGTRFETMCSKLQSGMDKWSMNSPRYLEPYAIW